MKNCVLLLFLIHITLVCQGQKVTYYSPTKGSGLDYLIHDVFPVDSQTTWLQTSWGLPLMAIRGDSLATYPSAITNLIPAWNVPVFGQKLSDGRTLLVNRYVFGTIHPTFGQANGGLLFENNNTFALLNSQNTFPLLGIQDAQWYCAAIDKISQKLWIGGDSGIRTIDLNSQNTRLYKPGFYGRAKGIPEKAVASYDGSIWFGTYSGRWLIAQNDTIVEFDNRHLGMDETYYIAMLHLTATSDTFALAVGPNGSRETPIQVFLIKNKSAINLRTRFSSLPENLEHIASETNNAIWLSSRNKLYRLFGAEIDSFDLGLQPQTRITQLKVGAGNRKWIGTIGEGVLVLDDVREHIRKLPKSEYCTNEQIVFEDSVFTIGEGIVSRFWDFGDGGNSSEQSPAYSYRQPGTYNVKVVAKDLNGSKGIANIKVTVLPNPYLSLRQPENIATCGSIHLVGYGTPGFLWNLPNGDTTSNYELKVNETGLYVATASNFNCSISDSIYVFIRPENQNINLSVTSDDETDIQNGAELTSFLPISVFSQILPNSDVCSGSWFLNGEKLSEGNSTRFLISETGKYIVEWKGINEDSCKREGRMEFTVGNSVIPNVVTQNSDRLNDFFEIRSSSTKKLNIYNRWGKTVFQTDNYGNNWPATDDKPGTYFYRLEMGGKIFNGWVEVVR